MKKRSIKALIFCFGIFLILNGFSPKGLFGGAGILGVGWTGLLMALGFILLAVSSNSLFEELVGEKNIKYVWYCWILVISVLLGGEEIEKILLFLK